MADALIAPLMRGPDALGLHRRPPVGGSRHGPVVGAKADQIRILAKSAAHQLADIVLTARGHLGPRRVAHVRVVRPHHRARGQPALLEHRLQRVEHVLVAQIP